MYYGGDVLRLELRLRLRCRQHKEHQHDQKGRLEVDNTDDLCTAPSLSRRLRKVGVWLFPGRDIWLRAVRRWI